MKLPLEKCKTLSQASDNGHFELYLEDKLSSSNIDERLKLIDEINNYASNRFTRGRLFGMAVLKDAVINIFKEY